MADYIVDLQKNGKNFAVLANTRSEEDIKGLPNANLPMGFRNELNAVHNFIFGTDMPLGEDDFSFLLKYREGRFDKIYYPNLVKGCAENEFANDPTAVYIRWGKDYKKLYMWETKKKNAFTIHLGTEEGNEDSEFDYSIASYGFNGDKYADPALVLNFIDDEGDSYTHYFPIKVLPVDSEENVDYVAKINTAMKRGMTSFLEVLAEGKEYKGSTPCVGARELEMLRSYEVTGFTVAVSKKGKEIVKLHLKDGFDVWCDYSLLNYIKSGDASITEENPVVMVVVESYTNLAKNGKEYTNFRIALSQAGDGMVEQYPNGTILSEEEAKEFFNQTEEKILSEYRFPVTVSDRDLDVDVEYKLVGYSSRPTRTGGFSHKLTVIDPRNEKRIELWCPNTLIPTIQQKPDITPERPSVFRVVSKEERNDRVYADSVIDLTSGSLVDSIDLNF